VQDANDWMQCLIDVRAGVEQSVVDHATNNICIPATGGQFTVTQISQNV